MRAARREASGASLSSGPSRPLEWAIALLAALPALAAYVWTLNPTVPAGDSGELITAAATFGVAHPPGYPLYVWIGRAWTLLLPFGDVAWRLNLMSAACAAAAAAVLAIAVSRLTRSSAAALVAAWTLAFSTPLWKYAVVAEVFALNALLASVALLACASLSAAWRAGAPAPSRWLATLALLSTLLLSHHHTLALLIGPLLAVAIAARFGGGGVRAALGAPANAWAPGAGRAMLLAAAAGLVPLVHLPLVSGNLDALVWGEADTLRGFLRHLLRVDYGSLRLDARAAGMSADRSHALLWLESLPAGLGWPALALACGGAITAWRASRGIAVGVGLFLAAQAWFFTRVGFPSDVAVLRGVIERFYILPGVVLALLAGLGAAWLLQAIGGAGGRGGREGGAREAPHVRIVSGALALLAIAGPLATHAARASQRGNHFTANLGRSVLAAVPAGGVLFVQGDLFHNTLAFLQRVERLRPDVTVVDQELLTYDWYVRRLQRTHPELLPRLGETHRIVLRDGRQLDGLAISRAGGRVDLLLEDANSTVDSGLLARVERHPHPEDAFKRTRARFRHGPLKPPSDERYSGLPGSRNLRWLDHLGGRRAVAFVGLKDDSWVLGYELMPTGMLRVAYPRGAAPGIRERAARSLEAASATVLDDFFRASDPWSFEAAERFRLADAAQHTLLILCRPEAAGLGGDTDRQPRAGLRREGRRRLLSFAERFEALDPTTAPECLRAVGFLRAADPGFRDLGRAREDLERYLGTGPNGPQADEARAVLAQIRGSRRQ